MERKQEDAIRQQQKIKVLQKTSTQKQQNIINNKNFKFKPYIPKEIQEQEQFKYLLPKESKECNASDKNQNQNQNQGQKYNVSNKPQFLVKYLKYIQQYYYDQIYVQGRNQPSIFKKIQHINFTNLKHLNLRQNFIKVIEPLSQLNAPNLIGFNIQVNQIVTMKSLQKIKFKSLRKIDLFGNYIQQFKFQRLYFTKKLEQYDKLQLSSLCQRQSPNFKGPKRNSYFPRPFYNMQNLTKLQQNRYYYKDIAYTLDGFRCQQQCGQNNQHVCSFFKIVKCIKRRFIVQYNEQEELL